MARKINPLGKLFIIILVTGGLFGLTMKYKDKIMPAAQKAGIATQKPAVAPWSTEGNKATIPDGTSNASGVKTLRVAVVTWPGYAGGQYFNKGFKANEESRFFKDYGFKAEFMVMDDYSASREAWKAGAVDLLWTTADSFPVEAESLKSYYPQLTFQADWSRGADKILVVMGIKSVADLRGRSIAVALGTPSHTLLLQTLRASNLTYKDVRVVEVPSAIDAASYFKAGKVDAAVVWSPDDMDCLQNVPGSSVLVSTAKATNIIADVFYAKKDFIESNLGMLSKFVEGFLRGAGEINTNPQAKAEAIKILAAGLNVSEDWIRTTIEGVRLVTYGDNLNFFGLNHEFVGVKGEDLYNQMARLYSDPLVKLVTGTVPPWRNVVNLSVLQGVNLDQMIAANAPEGGFKFTAPVKAVEIAKPALATKSVSISFATGSAVLDENAKTVLRMTFVDTAKQFASTRIRVEGNTDSVGKRETNLVLSEKRAQAVVNFLIAVGGFDPNRFVVVGNGPDKPVADNATDFGRAANRRTDLELLQ